MPKARLGRRRGPTRNLDAARLAEALTSTCGKCNAQPPGGCVAQDGHLMAVPHSVRYGAVLRSLP